MRINASSFKVSGASPADMFNLNESLQYLEHSRPGAHILDEMACKHVAINIVHDGHDSYDSTTNTIDWDPNAGHAIVGSPGHPGGIQSAAVALLHEGAHSTDDRLEEHENTPDSQYTNAAERYAIAREDAVAADLGEPQRFDHEGLVFRERNPTAHTPMHHPHPVDPHWWRLLLFLRG